MSTGSGISALDKMDRGQKHVLSTPNGQLWKAEMSAET